MSELTTHPGVFVCPACGRDVSATAVYGVVSTEEPPLRARDVRPAVGPVVSPDLTARLHLTGLRVEHECGSAVKPQGVMRGGVQPGVITCNHFVSGDPAEVADEVRRRAARAAEVGVLSGAR